MEMNQLEALEVEKVAHETSDLDLCQLADLQLALVGGGIGNVILG